MKTVNGLIAVALLGYALGCSKDRDVGATVSLPICYLDSIRFSGTVPYFETFIYDGKRITSAVLRQGASPATYEYNYDQQGRVSTIAGPGDTTTYTYNTHGQLATSTNPKHSQVNYTYDSNGQLAKEETSNYNATKGTFELSHSQTFTFADGDTNPESVSHFDSLGNLQYSVAYLYDELINPFSVLNTANSTTFPNNIIQQTITQSNLSPVVQTFTFTYNNNGYPLTQTTVLATGDTETTTYTYHCTD